MHKKEYWTLPSLSGTRGVDDEEYFDPTKTVKSFESRWGIFLLYPLYNV